MATAKDKNKVTFKFKDVTFSFKVGEDMPTEAYVAYEDGKWLKFLEISLGVEQWKRVLPLIPTLKELKEFSEVVNDAMGTTQGE